MVGPPSSRYTGDSVPSQANQTVQVCGCSIYLPLSPVPPRAQCPETETSRRSSGLGMGQTETSACGPHSKSTSSLSA